MGSAIKRKVGRIGFKKGLGEFWKSNLALGLTLEDGQ